MGISAQLGRRALGAAALLFGLAFAGMAQAVPIHAYTFELSGFVGSGATAGVLKGSFSGAVDPGGHITKNTLTSFHFESSGFDGALAVFNWTSDRAPYLFSYIPGDTSSFALVEYNFYAPVLTACIGGPVGILCNGGNARGAIATNIFGQGVPSGVQLAAASSSPPQLNGFIVSIGDPVYMTPIPAPLLMFATGLGALSCLAFFRRPLRRGIA